MEGLADGINFTPSTIAYYLPAKQGRLKALPSNIRLGWKWLTMANTTAYYVT